MNNSYISPENVKSPKKKITSEIKVLRDGGPDGWSLAKLTWGEEESYGIRWNGSNEDKGIGNPQSRGVPTWFILPKEIGNLIEANIILNDSLS